MVQAIAGELADSIETCLRLGSIVKNRALIDSLLDQRKGSVV